MNKYFKKPEWKNLNIWKEKCPKYIISELNEEEEDIIRHVGIWMSENKIRENIVVVPVNRENFEDMFGGFRLKTDVINGRVTQSFSYKMTQGYYASFILRGIKMLQEEVYKYFLVYIYLRELLTCHCQIRGYCYQYDYALQVYHALEKYVEQVCEYCYLGRDGFVDLGLPEQYGLKFTAEKYLELSRKEPEEFLWALCHEANEFWRAFFSEYCIVEYKLSEAMHQIQPGAVDPISDKWPGYIYSEGNICQYEMSLLGMSIYKPIAYAIIESKYFHVDYNRNVVVYLDGDITNLAKENIVLFKDKWHVIRYKEGKCSPKFGSDNLYFVDQEITKEELLRIVPRYTYKELEKIFNMSEVKIKKMMKDYNIPGKTILRNMKEEEIEALK